MRRKEDLETKNPALFAGFFVCQNSLREFSRHRLLLGLAFVLLSGGAAVQAQEAPAYSVDYETLLGNLLKEAEAREDTRGLISASQMLLQAIASSQKSGLSDQTSISGLGSVIAKSYERHPQSRVIGSRVNQVSANADQAFSALMPQVTFSADHGRRSIDATPFSSAQKYHYDATTKQLSLKQLIFDFGSTIGSYHAANRTKLATCYRMEYQRSEYFNAVIEASLSRQKIELLRYWTEVFSKQRELTAFKVKERFRLGVGTISDIAKAELKLSDTEKQKNSLLSQEAKIAMTLKNYGLDQELNVTDLAFVSAAWVENLPIDRHPLMMESRETILSARAQLASAKAKRYPQINLEASVSSRDYREPKSGASKDYSALVTMTMPLVDGGNATARISDTLARLEQSEAELDLREKSLQQLLNQAASDLSQLRQDLTIRQSAAKRALESFVAANELFLLKRSDISELQRAEDELYAQFRELIELWLDSVGTTYRAVHVSGYLPQAIGSPSAICQ